ncbi:MAG: hypothetical protein IID44_17270, partial [Planctomycetes bacterium]|nr:hypothetical protein [Planctomycetota bacterium]
VAYARHFRITGQTCSLLMLETDADYQRFNIKPEDDLFVVKSSPAGATIDKKISEAMTVLTDPKEGFTRWLSRLERMPGLEFRVSPALRVALDNLPPEAFEVPHSRLRAKHRTWDGMSDELKEKLSLGKVDYDMLQKEAQRRMSKYGEADALVALSSLIENSPGNLVLIRDVAYSAIEWGLNDQAYHLLHRVAMARPYEPQMYLAMAQSLAQAGKNDLALLYYEVASSGKWNNRFRDFERIVAVDYLHFLRQVDSGKRKLALKQYAEARLDRLKDTVKLEKADLLVTVMWNTDGTDVDLHIKEPTGEVCFYQNRRTRIGGQITQDCTQGFGPELYILPNARHGKYEIQVKYFARDTSRASGRTRVLATIYEGWGTKQERVIRKAVTLTAGKEMHAIATVGIEK